MKTLTGVLALMLALIFGASSVVGAAEKAAAPATVRKAGEKPLADKLMMTVKVTQVNQSAKTFTGVGQGGQFTFDAAKLPKLPTVGDTVDVTYTENPAGGPVMFGWDLKQNLKAGAEPPRPK